MTPQDDAEKELDRVRKMLTEAQLSFEHVGTDVKAWAKHMEQAIAQALRDARIEAIEQNAIFRKHLEELIEIQKRQGDDPYMVGMANGLICALSCYTGNEPEYVSKPKGGGK